MAISGKFYIFAADYDFPKWKTFWKKEKKKLSKTGNFREQTSSKKDK